MFQLCTAIIRPLLQNRSVSSFVIQLGSQEFTMLKYYCLWCMVKLKLLQLKCISVKLLELIITVYRNPF